MLRFGFLAHQCALASAIFVLVAGCLAPETVAQFAGWTTAPALEGYREIALPDDYPLQCNAAAPHQSLPAYGCQNGGYACATSPAPTFPGGGAVYGMQAMSAPCNVQAMMPPGAGATALWGGRVGALLLNREDENHRTFSYDSANEAFQLLDSQDSNFEDAFGVEAHITRKDLCTGVAMEGVYWGIFPEETTAYAYPSQVTANLNGIFNFDQLDYNGITANNYVDGALVHRLRRETEIHNGELNRLWDLSPGHCGCSPWQCKHWLGCAICGSSTTCSLVPIRLTQRSRVLWKNCTIRSTRITT